MSEKPLQLQEFSTAHPSRLCTLAAHMWTPDSHRMTPLSGMRNTMPICWPPVGSRKVPMITVDTTAAAVDSCDSPFTDGQSGSPHRRHLQ